jgi:hypothetical protein
MNAKQLMNPAHLFVEIGQDTLRAFNGTTGIELPVERLADGRLSEACKSNLALQLQRFIDRKSWQPRVRVFCAIGARGVSLRRISLPAASKEELQRLLPLQIENEFPLSPEELAWGFQQLATPKSRLDVSNGKQELLVAALRKDSLEEYANVLALCGAAVPVFTVAAFARSYLVPQPTGPYAVLAIERNYSELITLDGGVPAAVRVLSWGRENIVNVPSATRGNGHDEPVGALTSSVHEASFGGAGPPPKDGVWSDVLDPLVRLINGQSVGRRVYVIGSPELRTHAGFTTELATRLGVGVECQWVDSQTGAGTSAAILGLQKAVVEGDGWPPLVLRVKQGNGKVRITRQVQLKWAAVAIGLALLSLILPYAEALALKSHLARKLAAIKTDQGRLVTIDRELDFLQYLKENESPYLDALLVLAKSAPQGTRFDSVSMNRHGDVSIRGALPNGQQVADFRSKLINSGFFANVGVEEQTPTPDRQKVNVRMSAQWKPESSRTTPGVEPSRPSAEQKSFPPPMTAVAPPDNGPPPQIGGPSPQMLKSPIPRRSGN